MLTSMLSGDFPRSRMLTAVVMAIFIGLLLAPFLFPGTRSLNTAATICIFIVLVASYDFLLGYTGIVSFAHTMFFGIGAYGVAIALETMGPSWGVVLLGSVIGLILAVGLALVIGLFSLRVQAIFFAMVTLAVASAFLILASQLSWLTGGEDGITYRVPRVLSPAFKLVEDKVFGVRINGRVLSYYLVFVGSGVLFLIMMRLVNSPFGSVLKAIRENEFRAEGLGLQDHDLPHARQRARRRHCRLGGCVDGAVAQIHRPRYNPVAEHHDRHPVDGRDWGHGHDVRRRGRRDPVRAGQELPAEPDGHCRRRLAGHSAAAPTWCTRTAGCCGWVCCSSSVSISSPPASSEEMRSDK